MPQTTRRKSFFITLEGPEGSGKSSQAVRLVRSLKRAGWPVVFVRDPGSTNLGRRLRTLLLRHPTQRLSPMTEAMLFIAARIQLVEERIRPALANGRVVVCDRFHDSTVAYQGFGGGVDVNWLDRMGSAAIEGVMPHLTILLDVPVEIGFSRLRRRRDRIEQKARAFHRRLRQGYLQLAKRNRQRTVVIDAAQPAQVVRRRIEAVVRGRLGDGAKRS